MSVKIEIKFVTGMKEWSRCKYCIKILLPAEKGTKTITKAEKNVETLAGERFQRYFL